MRSSGPLLTVLMFGILLVLACDDSPVEREVDDEAYLAVMCMNLERFSEAILVEKEEAGIATVIEKFIDELQILAPPSDMAEFHEAFISYLEEAVGDPTRPLVVPPPLPDKDVRERLANKERSVDECRAPTFFSSPTADQ